MRRFAILKVVFFSCLFISDLTDAVIKRWTRDTNFDNPANWNEGSRLPCPNEEIDFPATCPVVYVGQDYTIKQMTLPANGMILLNTDLTLVFNDHPSTEGTGCDKVRGITFIGNEYLEWMDPDNWCIPKHDLDTDCMDRELFLNSEMVPTAMDDVIFAGESSYYVGINFPEDISVRSFKIGNQNYDSDGLESYFKSLVGSSQFRRAQMPAIQHKIRVVPRSCNNNTGCMSGNDNGWRLQQICNNMKKNLACDDHQCTQPFKPVGHCCDICGSMVVLDYSSTFSRINFMRFIHDTFINIKESSYTGVKVIVSKRFDDKIQLVLRDDTPHGYKAARLGQLVVDKVNEVVLKIRIGICFCVKHITFYDPAILGIARVISLTSSYAPPITISVTSPTTSSGVKPSSSPSTGKTPTDKVPPGSVKAPEALSTDAVAGLSAAGVAVFILIIVAVSCLVARKWGHKSFLTFKKQFRPDVTYPSVSADFSDPGNPSVRGFDNPMFGESPAYGTQLQEIHSSALSDDPKAGFDNPLYDSPIEGTFFSDPSRVDSSVKVNPVYSTMGIEEETNA